MTKRSNLAANDSDSENFSGDLPVPPREIPDWATREGTEWRRKSEFEILAKAEEYTGLTLDLKFEALPDGVWGIHVVRGEHGRIYVNAALPPIWRRFAIFHELYHLLYNKKGARFWAAHTFQSMESFENRADTFAWAAIWPEWSEGDYADWS